MIPPAGVGRHSYLTRPGATPPGTPGSVGTVGRVRGRRCHVSRWQVGPLGVVAVLAVPVSVAASHRASTLSAGVGGRQASAVVAHLYEPGNGLRRRRVRACGRSARNKFLLAQEGGNRVVVQYPIQSAGCGRE